MAKGDDIEERIVDFAVSVVKFVDGLPRTQAGRISPISYYEVVPRLRPITQRLVELKV